jgi:hypothetical protein
MNSPILEKSHTLMMKIYKVTRHLVILRLLRLHGRKRNILGMKRRKDSRVPNNVWLLDE